ncbi:hypothetical protein QC763_0013320 [Podospora pseudopauciseta]|uniref:Uncharacterized protein n=1 Tax=Podospora pseudopauciseta TaxID=2093780 RepID=A0ABR0HZM8_9PEZI|nr:hypothetical protein QC763_0013320 [Podospora pseudopauciseta]
MRLTPSLSVPPSCVPLERTGSGVLPFPPKPRPCAFPCLCLSSLAVPKKLFPIRGVFFWGWIRQLVKSLCQRLPIRQTRLELQDASTESFNIPQVLYFISLTTTIVYSV